MLKKLLSFHLTKLNGTASGIADKKNTLSVHFYFEKKQIRRRKKEIRKWKLLRRYILRDC